MKGTLYLAALERLGTTLRGGKCAQNHEEEIDQVKVQLDARDDEVVDAELVHNHVGVVDDVATEDERADDAVPYLEARAVFEEDKAESKDDAPNDEQAERREEEGAQELEIVPREDGVPGQANQSVPSIHPSIRPSVHPSI
eukprot:CAMPEP_0174716576 /NCGR_PEP_ID=MMETSP1094-20130205/24326_1 /TAXON_ID=156173 /ORGANISM="Chrysochromulina brevifilum, Strain UTEX LB 985" /LENGTH=140 /DNA_ID=CAMNT_0015916345 /DNA_START=434 /DNA_END=854 /DNA_ORIENTATION=+